MGFVGGLGGMPTSCGLPTLIYPSVEGFVIVGVVAKENCNSVFFVSSAEQHPFLFV